ncbi:MAG TPA: 16S rRNA (adenine(1518)-N(6)/adenine(1519)-N(6))-dimethyltransferase RsmA [Candidatus Dormibacteraeota bacterium]|nr:16S rRNA (adenine(1518)-N(6)/adenine(1519)-N(6))-dimethyltransferase RsmA [Candidatus Dormibacteraeota bacterium]HEX2680783.1 16S rRNA (adenine(1518)-N(6)/adenine(1519)-N(6))-dimethyltransferase RsmA [Candidatus Dormibacteraeota bacterium]
MGAPIDPADQRQLEGLLRRHHINLKHRLGQNFLIDPALRDAIADASGVTKADDVLEVGAGVGTLTTALAALAGRVIAVELDRDLIPALREVVGELDNVEVVQGDILRLDVSGDVVVGNIPYNLTGALIRKLLDRPPRPRRLSFVVQKEVADRWTASTGASLATVAVQVFADARTVMSIPAAAFTPIPRVDSALVILDVRPTPAIDVEDLDAFFRFVEALFQQRRKQLGGVLAGRGFRDMARLGIDPRRRPQTLTLVEWEKLFRAVKS